MSRPTERQAADGYRDAQAKGLLPIREVAAITGVNPVTLRAWERRYGLIVPYRTAKGHRLYAPHQVQTIQAVLAWLDRGVSVGQVKALLHAAPSLPADQAAQWQHKRERLKLAIDNLSERQLDEGFNAELSLYPPRVLCQHLLLPLFETLEQRWRQQPGAQTQRLFLHTWLRSKLGARVYHDNRQHQGPAVLLINLGPTPMAPALWLSAWLIGSANCPVAAFDGPIPAAELATAIELLQPRALLLFSDADPDRLLPAWLHDWGLPCLLIGVRDAGPGQALPANLPADADITLVADPLAALQVLADRRLLAQDSPCCN
ncbi:MerR family transcriptional regulator [Phytopseudomonas dryadis]|uniref:Helix-turn-helix-type transcriptional regulator n=1 Tax=Phytopseudomonas dryadis TaxID=2487520 RepID=A0A4Q9R700_9GAMM|nr:MULTISPECIES: MerR family transcriptional regulator [Pseudomonas]TBU96324.1 helix-turn-helix-type transcriptional regulator [Pseudomonas dryadis]TBU99535.1 helix-turn-helix-type transcriptional regulator [Pseudomonas dryadis]TBV14773.1 helix-turn-helix-type transcriptional regulator [Pseudomonas sp. FRB 230]